MSLQYKQQTVCYYLMNVLQDTLILLTLNIKYWKIIYFFAFQKKNDMSALGFLINLCISDSQPTGLECVVHHSVMSNSFVTLWTEACQAPLFMGLSWQEYWSGLPFPTLGDLPGPGIEPVSPVALALTGGFFTTEPPGKRYRPSPGD